MARKRLTSLPEELWEKLSELETCVRQLDVVRGCGWTLAVAAICLGGGLLADMTLELPLALRIGLLWLAIAVTLLSAVWMIWRPWRRHHSVLDLAAVVERAHPELKESLVSCIELYDTTIPESERGSALMRELAAKQTLHNVAPLDFRDAVSGRPAHRMFLGGLLAWTLLLAPLMLTSQYRLLVARFFAPWQNLDRVTSFWFELDRGDRVVVRGSDVTVTAQPRGEATDFPETAQLNWVDEQGETDSRRVDFDATTKLYSTTIPHVTQGFQYHLSGAGNRSRTYRIQVVEAPAITELKVEIQPPAYTGQPAKVLDGPVGEIEVLERSRLNWMLTFNKPMQAAEWQWQPDADAASKSAVESQLDQSKVASKPTTTEKPASPTIPLKLAADKLSASLENIPEQGGAFRLTVRDEHGLTNEADVVRQLTVLPDRAPTLTVSGGNDALTAQASDSVPIEAAATDDVGIGALELHYEVDATRQGVVKCESKELGRPEIKHQFHLELSGLNLRNGEMVSFRVRAADERPVPGPNETWSDRRLIRIDDQAKLPGTDQLAADQAELENALKQLHVDLAEHREQTEKLKTDAAAAARDKPDAETARQTQEQLEAAADQQEELQARLEQLAAALEKHPLFSKLTQQAQQLAEEEFAKAQESLNAAEQAEPQDRAEDLQAAEEQLTQAEQKLQDMERQFGKLAKLERDLLELNRLAANAEQLAQRLRELDKQQREPVPANETPQERENREQLQQAEKNQIAAEQQQLAKKAEELLQRQPELQAAVKQNQIEQLAQLAQQAEQLAQPQQQLAEDLRAAADKAATDQKELAERQQALQEQAEKLNQQIAEQRPAGVKPLDEKLLDKALEELQAGNLGAAAKEEERLAKMLDELEQKLRDAPQEPAKKDLGAPAKVAQQLAERQNALAKAAREEAEQGKPASPEQQAATEKELAEQQEQLEKLAAKPAESEKEAAESALKEAAEKQQQLAEQAKTPNPDLKDKPEEQKKSLESLLKENAVAQQEAAESLEKLADQLKQAGENEPTQSPDEPSGGKKPPTEVAAADSPKNTPDNQPGSEKQADTEKQPGTEKAEPSESLDSPEKPGTPMPDGSKPKSDPQASPNDQPKDTPESTPENSTEPDAKSSPNPGSKPGKKPEPGANPAADQAGKLAQEARELQQQFEQAQQAQDLSEPKARQEKLAESLSQLNDQIEQAQKRLQQASKEAGTPSEKQGSKPGSKPGAAGQPGSKAGEQAAKAQQAMEEAGQELAQGNLERSAEAGEKAAEALQELGQKASSESGGQKPGGPSSKQSPSASRQPSAGQKSESSDPGAVPSEAAEAVHDAVNQLQEALSAPPAGGAPMPGAEQAPGPAGQQPGTPSGEAGEPGEASESGQPGESGKPGSGPPSSAAPSPLQAAANRLQQAANALRQASAQSQGEPSVSGQEIAGTKPGSQGKPGPAGTGQGENGPPSEGEGKGAPGLNARGGGNPTSDAGVPADGNLARLKKRLAGRKWGELPSNLQTEILQAAQKKPNSEYGDLIRQYFKEIAKTQPTTTTKP